MDSKRPLQWRCRSGSATAAFVLSTRCEEVFALFAQKAGPLFIVSYTSVHRLCGLCGAQARQRHPHGFGQ